MQVVDRTDPAKINKRFAYLQPGGLVFDIGANCGQSVARFLPKFDRVVAVEPAAESFAVLDAEYGTDLRVTVLNMACTDQAGHLDLDVRDVIDTGQLTTGRRGQFPWGDKHSTRQVTATTVDALTEQYGPPDLLKVDTEGHELFVLQGATETLKTGPRVIIEIHSAANGRACRKLLGDPLEQVGHDPAHYPAWMVDNHYWLIRE